MSSFENQWGVCWGSQRLWKQSLCSKRVYVKISHSISISTEAVVLEKPGSGPLAHLEKPPERQEATGTPCRVGMLAAAILGACSTVWTLVLESAT